MLDAMLHRIGYAGSLSQDAATLVALHRAWRCAVPYENLDIQLGREIRLDEPSLLDKLVRRRRGGYCYEQNGGLASLLRAAGFPVTMAEAGVLRETRGDAAWGNHTVLLVDVVGQRWLADAGIGDGFLDPLPLREGVHEQRGLTYRLERLDAETWRFVHHPNGSIGSYDFRMEPRELADFAGNSHRLSTSPESPYVTTLVVARPQGDHTLLLLSRTLRRMGADGRTTHTVGSVEEFANLLAGPLGVPLRDLGEDAVAHLWECTGAQDDLRARIERRQATI